MVSLPPWGMASRALTARLSRTCSSCDGVSQHAAQVGGQADGQLDVLTEGALQHAVSVTTSFSSSTRGCMHPAKREQLLGQRRGPLGGGLDLLKIGGPSRSGLTAFASEGARW